MPDFLIEIGTEEIPARMIEPAAAELQKRLGDLLTRERLPATNVIECFNTPRRLALIASGIPAAQPDVTEQASGPSVAVAFKDGQPTPAAHAFAKKAGVDVGKLEKVSTPKGEYLSAKITKKGRPAAEVLTELLPKEIASLYWPKNMYWQKPSERFVRPIRWLVAMLDSQVVPLEFAGLRAGKTSRGHRQLGNESVEITSADSYANALYEAKVMAQDARKMLITEQLKFTARLANGFVRPDDSLLDTVVNLTEWPSVVLGEFDPEFLSLPEEILVTVMRDHQKYFAVEDGQGKLLPNFLAVLNTDGDPQGMIRHGHERVLRARFNDARFFWQTDQKRPLRERVELLKNVTFQKDLGSYYDKTIRVQHLCSGLSEIIRQNGGTIRPGIVHKAVCLAKTDLTTELVKEFTELQGIVGGLYARVQALDPDLPEANRLAIAEAVYDHYKPESMDDSVPRSTEAAVVSIGDKADSIAGMFALGLVPSGSKDPFALRRQANGIVKTIAEHKLPIQISTLMKDARAGYAGSAAEKKFTNAEYTKSVEAFFRERVEFYLREALGFRYDVVNAVLAEGSDAVGDAVARTKAVSDVLPVPEFQAVAAASKRIRNILKQAGEKKLRIAEIFELFAGVAEEEKILAAYLQQNSSKIEAHREKKEYKEALLLLSSAREPVDKFFDKVMVMVDDERIRANRLALLQTLLKEFSTIADFSEIVTEGTKESSK
ncbi:MAG TPA: glycine--tRNA ligase subunit beta [Terriglobales bacterium]|jgi:glycyl-tRNA synthetase beta chain